MGSTVGLESLFWLDRMIVTVPPRLDVWKYILSGAGRPRGPSPPSGYLKTRFLGTTGRRTGQFELKTKGRTMERRWKESEAYHQIIIDRWVFGVTQTDTGNRKWNCQQRLSPGREKGRKAQEGSTCNQWDTQRPGKDPARHGSIFFIYWFYSLLDRKYDQSYSHPKLMDRNKKTWFLQKRGKGY